MKKGQITLFIVAGILVVSILGILMMYSQSVKEGDVLFLDSEPIKVYVDRCIEDTAIDAVYAMGARGGYHELVKVDTEYIEIPYYLYLGTPHFPSVEIMEIEYSKYIEDNLEFCLDNFSSFREIGYDFEVQEMSAESSFNEKTITVRVDYPIVVSQDKESAFLKDFFHTVEFEFIPKHDMIKSISEEIAKTPNRIPMSALMTKAVENDAFVDIIELGEGNVVVAYTFNESIRYDQKFVFAFMARYNWSHLVDESREVNILPVDDVFASEGVKTTINIESAGKDVVFSDFTELFDIDPSTGLIEFTPKKEDAGKHAVIIKASNQHDADVETFDIIINSSNSAPVISPIPDQDIKLGDSFTHLIVASDPDDDPVSFYPVLQIPGLNIEADTGLLEFTPAAEGIHTISVLAVDEFANFGKETFEVRVTR